MLRSGKDPNGVIPTEMMETDRRLVGPDGYSLATLIARFVMGLVFSYEGEILWQVLHGQQQ